MNTVSAAAVAGQNHIHHFFPFHSLTTNDIIIFQANAIKRPYQFVRVWREMKL